MKEENIMHPQLHKLFVA